MSRVDEVLRWVQGPKILDIGCTGHKLEVGSKEWVFGRLTKGFPNVIGIDISEENISKLKSLGFSNVYVQDAQSFQFEEKFSTIVAGELIEHLSNPGLFIQNSINHLAGGGRLIITTPNPFSLLNSFYAYFKYPKTCQNDEHTCWFCPQTISTLVSRYGLNIVYFDLVSDYRNDDESIKYRLFIHLIRLFGFVLPKRLKCNSMLLVLEQGNQDRGIE